MVLCIHDSYMYVLIENTMKQQIMNIPGAILEKIDSNC